jgi:hypothetical protein
MSAAPAETEAESPAAAESADPASLAEAPESTVGAGVLTAVDPVPSPSVETVVGSELVSVEVVTGVGSLVVVGVDVAAPVSLGGRLATTV